MIQFLMCNWIWNILLFQAVSPLKLTVKPVELPLQDFNQGVLKKIFIELRKFGEYNSIAALLTLKTFDTFDAYVSSCYSMTAKDYEGLMEFFYNNHKYESNVLGMVLSSECIMAMDKNIFTDKTIALSLKELPKSLLSIDEKSFSFRISYLCDSFCRIVSHAQERLFLDTNWDNLVISPPPYLRNESERLCLKEVLTSCKFDRINSKDLFYYLNPTMITKSEYPEDILWLIELALPEIRLHPQTSLHIDGKYLSYLNLQLFKTVSTISFYLEIQKSLRFNSNENHPLKVGKGRILERIEALTMITSNLLGLNSPCRPFNALLKMIKTLLLVFFPEMHGRMLFTNNEIKYLFKSIYRSFSKYSPKYIQGDWLFNLLYIFFDPNFEYLSEESVRELLEVFFCRRPTNSAIGKVHSVLEKINSAFLRKSVLKAFEMKIPNDRLKQIYMEKLVPFQSISNRFVEISFKDRFIDFLKSARKKLGIIDFSYTGDPWSFPSLHLQKAGPLRKKFLIETFQQTILALYRKENCSNLIYSYGKFQIIENNLVRSANIRECLNQIFQLILLIPEFRILKGNDTKTNKPVIYVTPLISRPVSNVFGQILAIAIILNIPIPFIIHPNQLAFIFQQAIGSSEFKSDIKVYFEKSASYLNLLKKDQNISINSRFPRILRSFFKSFYSWNMLFFQSENKTVIDELIDKSLYTCNSQIYSGFDSHFEVSKFTFNEILVMFSK